MLHKHDAQENENGVESTVKETEAISTAVALPDSAIVLLNRLQVTPNIISRLYFYSLPDF